MKHTSPWRWIPTLYIAEGLPYFAVNTLTVLIYTKMGIGLKEMALFTGWLYLPWVIKPFWSPFVDAVKTKRWWTLCMQFLICVTCALVVFLLPLSFFFASTLAVFWMMAFFSATHDIAADGYYMLELDSHQQAAFVGVRSTFYRIASVLGQGGLVIVAGLAEQHWDNITLSWQIIFGILSVFFLLVWLYHLRFLPVSSNDKPGCHDTAAGIVKGFGKSFGTFFSKAGIWSALLFMMLYRLPEALCIKIIQPFMVMPRAGGGLELSTAQVGFVNGTVGVISLLVGGIAGGLSIARFGLKKCLWPMAASLTLPCILYCYLATVQPSSLHTISIAVAVEQFGYGFGFTAYMLYLIYFSRGQWQTSHYAFCTAFMALGMMLPGMAAGWLFESLNQFRIPLLGENSGFIGFFWFVVFSSLATFIGCALVRIDPDFGLKSTKKTD